MERYSSVGEQQGLGLVQRLVVGSCSSGLVQMDGRLELDDHHLRTLGCSIFRHMIHHRIGWMCRIGRRSYVEIELVDIVVEQLVELAEEVLVEQLANDLR